MPGLAAVSSTRWAPFDSRTLAAGVRVLEPANVIDPGAGRVDDRPGGDREPRSGDDVDDVRAGDGASRDPEALDARVVQPDGSEELRRPQRGEHETSVVGLMVVVGDVGRVSSRRRPGASA